MALIVIAGFLLRCWHTFQTSSLPTVQEPLGDSLGYLNWAVRISAGQWYGNETFYQAPLYPYFLAVLMLFAGPSILFIRLVQAFLGAMACGFIGAGAKRLFDPKTGVIAAVLAALYAPAIYYDGIIQKASLSMFLIAALFYLLTVLQSQQPRKRQDSRTSFRNNKIVIAVGIGVVLGLLCLTRENALLWIPLIPIWIGWIFRKATTESWPKLIGGYGLGLFLVLFPVAARNASLGGEWSPTTFQSGPNFYIGNGIGATGVYQPLVPGHESPEFERADAQAIAEYETGRALSAREVSKFWMTRSLADIYEQPGRWVALLGRKILMTFNNYEVPDVESPAVHRFWSVPLNLLWYVSGFGLIFPLAAVGMLLMSSGWSRFWLFPMLALTMAVAVAMFFILGRYRLPVATLSIPFAAYALANFKLAINTPRRSIVAGTVLVSCLVVAFLPVHNVRELTASAYMNTGVAYGRQGNIDASMLWMKRSIEMRGETATGLYNLAGAQLLAGDNEAALQSLLKARELDFSFLEVELQLGQLYEQRGEYENARKHYTAASKLSPQDTGLMAKINQLDKFLKTSNSYSSGNPNP